jgi:hypothetical protein
MEYETLLQEATKQVEDMLALEDRGWITLGAVTGEPLTDADRKLAVSRSRLYAAKDPLARQAIRLWTDYTFGSGIAFATEDEKAQEILSSYWTARRNRSCLSAQGQRTCSDKLLVDGEVFFAMFLGSEGEVTVRRIDPLEITEIITDPEDADSLLYYKREWASSGSSKTDYYRAFDNIEGRPGKDSAGKEVSAKDGPVVYHVAYNTLGGARGLPLLLPALDWIQQYRRFLASRIAVMLALARFAWKGKVQGGAAAVGAAKATYEGKTPAAGSVTIENMGMDMQPIRTDSNARNAYDDGRMIKLQVCAAVGIPEQYFGDLETGNLATAKTVELPMAKMFQSYQAVWRDAYKDLDDLVLEHNEVPEDKRYVDRDFPAIAPENLEGAALSIASLLTVLPALGDSRDVQQQALLAMGVLNPNEALDAMAQEAKSMPEVALAKALRRFQEAMKNGHLDTRALDQLKARHV